MPGHLPTPKYLAHSSALAYEAGRASVLLTEEKLAMVLCSLSQSPDWRVGRYAGNNNQWFYKAKKLHRILIGGAHCRVYCQDTAEYINVL